TYPTYPTYPSYNDGFNGSTYLSGSITNRWSTSNQEAITYTATLSNPNTATNNVAITVYDSQTGNELGRCTNNLTCAVTVASTPLKNVTIYARAVDQRGTAVESSRLNVSYGISNWYNNNPDYNNNNNYYPTPAFTAQAHMGSNRSEVNYNESVVFTAYVDSASTDIRNVTIRIYDANDNTELARCTGTWSCATQNLSYSRSGNQVFNVQSYTILSDQYGRTISRIYSPTVVVRPVPVYVPPQPTFQVTNVTAAVSSGYDTCYLPMSYAFTGTITTNGAGTVTYTWERSDGAQSPQQTLSFSGAGSQTVTNSWELSATYSGWQRLRILGPNDMTSNQASISHNHNCYFNY
ncbi:hypothetical protein KBA73_01565, partial [Patescibacteria group bacterium]|nr:hypothetical protein [Patescibacteria group bacterium]